MAGYTTQDIRNIAFVGHGGCGKTTLVERILTNTKTIGRMGTVEDGNTVCDFEAEEKEHQHSLNSAIVHLDYAGKRLNIIDTPGYPDFIGLAIGVLPAVDTVFVVIDADKGIQNVTRRMMKITAVEKIPRAIIINKIDHGGKIEELVETLQATFGKTCLPVNLPTQGGKSVIDCLGNHEGDADFSSVADAHTSLIDQAVEVDDELMEKYLESGEVSKADLAKTFTRAVCEGHLIPILFTSGKDDTGITELLNLIVGQLPSPADQYHRTFMVKETEDSEEVEWKASPGDGTKPFVGHVFRIATDPFVGKLAAFRVHQGTFKSGNSVHLDDGRKPVRISHLFLLQGKEHVDHHTAIPGDIVAVAKIDEMHYNAVLHEGLEFNSIKAKPIPQPKPMYGLSVAPKKRGDEGKISQSIGRLTDEDPTFTVGRDPSTKEMVMRGIGELHLRIIIQKLKGRFNLEVETAPPKIAYKETVARKAEGHHRHKKQTGGAGQFGEVYMRIEPLPQDHETGFEFVDDTFGGSVPKQYLPAIEKGVRQIMLEGCVAGYPMYGIRVSVYDGKYHPVDSKEVAFVTAGKKAFMDAVNKAKPVLLEPFVHLEITMPNEYMGDVTGDLAGRRGRVQGADSLPGGQSIITAVAPLGEVMTYANALKAMTQGTGTYTMEFSHEEPTPPNVQAQVVASYKPKADED